MNYDDLADILSNGAGIRFTSRLQPAGGAGDKVFPPTYEGGKYAKEMRKIDGVVHQCVHLDSVQSQANRIELALLEAIREDRIRMPIVEVVFPSDDSLLRQVGRISHLEAPHRIADAILRDSDLNGVRFRESEVGAVLNSVSLENATDLFRYAPTCLVFGMWDSTGPMGGLGAKIQRALSSEVVAIGAEFGVKTSSRLDPLGITLSAGPIHVADEKTGEWTLEAKTESGKSRKLFGKDGRPSEVNHGNIAPSISMDNGGVTFDYALQRAVISLPMIRRFQFPIAGARSREVDAAARSVLVATAILGVSLSNAKGMDLRTRTLLVPEGPAKWEAVMMMGETRQLEITAEGAIALYNASVEQAVAVGLSYETTPVQLTPSKGLVDLVRRSKEIAIDTGGE